MVRLVQPRSLPPCARDLPVRHRIRPRHRRTRWFSRRLLHRLVRRHDRMDRDRTARRRARSSPSRAGRSTVRRDREAHRISRRPSRVHQHRLLRQLPRSVPRLPQRRLHTIRTRGNPHQRLRTNRQWWDSSRSPIADRGVGDRLLRWCGGFGHRARLPEMALLAEALPIFRYGPWIDRQPLESRENRCAATSRTRASQRVDVTIGI